MGIPDDEALKIQEAVGVRKSADDRCEVRMGAQSSSVEMQTAYIKCGLQSGVGVSMRTVLNAVLNHNGDSSSRILQIEFSNKHSPIFLLGCFVEGFVQCGLCTTAKFVQKGKQTQ